MFNRKIQLNPLPLNMPDFQDWSKRIILKSNLPTSNIESQEFALASMILESNPNEFFRPDEYYVNRLRKAASDQVALQVIEDLREKRKQKNLSEATLKQSEDAKLGEKEELPQGKVWS